jgi:hypothetical protein
MAFSNVSFRVRKSNPNQNEAITLKGGRTGRILMWAVFGELKPVMGINSKYLIS